MQVCFTTFGHQTNQLWIAEDVPVIASTLYSEVKCSLVRGVPIKKQSPRKKPLYFSIGSMDLCQTFRLCV